MKKKILSLTIGPVLVLGLITIVLMLTMVKDSMMDEVQEALKGTAAATLAAYDQNTGDYIESSNGDIWKGSYNISKSESLVDRIKENSGMDVTFFYGDRRIMTSALDDNGERILNSPAGERIVEKVLNGGEEYFSKAVSLEGELNYGYYMPVYQNGTTDQIIGMVFVGTNKKLKDAVVNKILGSIILAVCIVMLICIVVGAKLSTSMTKNIKVSIGVVSKVADGDLNVWVDDKLLKRKDEIGELSKVTITLRDTLKNIIQGISTNAKSLLEASEMLGTAADKTNGTMSGVREAVNQIVENSTEQAQNSQNTSDHMKIMGEKITETVSEVELLDHNAVSMQESSTKASDTLTRLREINEDVERIISEVQEQTNRTNDSVQRIYEATTFIASIAEETNLLSLNASIEAARAGENGKGFAVVATQIGKLAQTSAESVHTIEGLIQQINGYVADCVTQANVSVGNIGESSQLITVALETFDSIFNNIAAANELVESMVAKVSKVDDVATNVAAISEEQAASSQEILATSDTMVSQAQEITQSSIHAADDSRELSVSAKELANQVNKFKI